MAVLLSLTAGFSLILAGGGIACLLAPRGWTWIAVEAAAVALLLGAAYIGLTVFALGLVLSGLALQLTVLAGAVTLAGVGAFAVRRRVLKIERHRPTALESAAWLVVLAQLGFAAWITFYRSGLGWDGLVNWEMKAHLACLNNGSPPLVYFQNTAWQLTHPSYPWLVPSLQTWLYLWLGECNQSLGKLVPLMFCVAAVGLLYAGAVRLAGSRLSGLLAAMLLFCIPLVLSGEGSATSGYADFPLGVAYLGAGVYLLSYARTQQTRVLGLVGEMSILLVWTKAEGAILLGCIGAVLCFYLWRTKAAKRDTWITAAALALLPGVLVYGAWRVFLTMNQTAPAGEFLPVSAETLAANIGRVNLIAAHWRGMSTNWGTWGVFWPFLLGACLLIALRPRGIPRGMLALLVLPLAVYSASFIFSAWGDPADHIASALDRLALQVAPLGALTIALALNNLLRLAEASPQRREVDSTAQAAHPDRAS